MIENVLNTLECVMQDLLFPQYLCQISESPVIGLSMTLIVALK